MGFKFIAVPQERSEVDPDNVREDDTGSPCETLGVGVGEAGTGVGDVRTDVAEEGMGDGEVGAGEEGKGEVMRGIGEDRWGEKGKEGD